MGQKKHKSAVLHTVQTDIHAHVSCDYNNNNNNNNTICIAPIKSEDTEAPG